LATANAICVRFQLVADAWADLRASRTAGAMTATSTATMLAVMVIGISLRNQCGLHEVAMVLILIAGLLEASRASPDRTPGSK
jgi:hypothetical protein